MRAADGNGSLLVMGQRALLLESHEGNLLFDCILLINEPTIEIIREGG
jgi:hypothetical protein